MSKPCYRGVLCLAVLFAGYSIAPADEGVWLYNRPPTKKIKERYGVDVSPKFLEHLQKASANVSGASGAFVSAEGLLLSNQHVVSRVVQRMSTAERNLTRDGYYARTQEAELPCPGLEVSVLLETEDVTAQVNSAVKPDMNDEEAFLARRAAMAKIEAESNLKTGLRSRVVTLFQGAQYHLYRSKIYTDVRLVFVPDEQIAFFGGDVDNFEFPRWNLDIAFLRAYESGRPARVEHFLKWGPTGTAEGELVFMSGHPARTDRFRTVAELKYLRDTESPHVLERLKRVEVLLASYSQRSREHARQARADLRGAENSRKARDGRMAGLLDPALMSRKQAAEAELRAAAAGNPELSQAADAWERIEKAQAEIFEKFKAYDLLESGTAFNTALFTHARYLVRLDKERKKAEGDRLDEYRPSSLPSIELAVSAEQPYYPELETAKLADSLTFLAEKLGAEHPLVVRILDGKNPFERAAVCVKGTSLSSASTRKELLRNGVGTAVSSDPMLQLAEAVDSDARELRSFMEARTESIRQAHGEIGKVLFALKGDEQYPDATGTLRLSFGRVAGVEVPEAKTPAFTTFAGLYKRASDHGPEFPFDLSTKWVRAQKKLHLSTPMNFVSTCDTLGGNSGSPVVDGDGELVGVVFDGNIYSLRLDLQYDDTHSRSVAVDSRGIIEALRVVYRADALIQELGAGKHNRTIRP